MAQTTANLRLAGQFVHELIEDPERHEALPDAATLVLFPGDDPGDPALSQANLRMAADFTNQGRPVTTWVVGLPTLPGLQVLPRWPQGLEEGASVTYDRQQDRMTVVFSQTDRPTIPTPINRDVLVLVDHKTHVATSMTIARYPEVAAPKAPVLAFCLVHPSTRLIGMTNDDLVDLVTTVLHEVLERRGLTMTWSQVVEALSA